MQGYAAGSLQKLTAEKENEMYTKIKAEGLLKKRALLNYKRLQIEHYTPQNVFQKESYNWYGDWEGRAILALAHASLSTGENIDHLTEIVQNLPAHYNTKGYLGPVYENGIKDEQQLAGHSWLMRGLLAYVKITGDKNVEKQLHTIVQNLIMPLKGSFKDYPAGSLQRAANGESMGTTVNEIVNGWKLSTDVGCAFILLDGITDVFETYGGAELQELAEEMIEHFLEIDVEKEAYQTHATLTSLRAVLRYMKTTKRYLWLDKVVKKMQIYIDKAMTETYQNYNWFGIPKATEPCAVTDSFIVALELWEIYEDVQWLDLAENIFYNGFLSSQRDNGGFGCEACTGADLKSVYFTPKHYEAYWCCSMRGAEGFLRYLEKSVLIKENMLTFPIYNSFLAEMKHNDITEISHATDYPYQGKGKIVIQTKKHFDGTVRLYIPKCAENFSISVNGKNVSFSLEKGFAVIFIQSDEDITIRYNFEMIAGEKKALRYPGFTKRKGVLILAEKMGESVPLMDVSVTKIMSDMGVKYRVLYPNK